MLRWSESETKMELKQMRVLVTPTSFGKNDPELREELRRSCGEVIFNESGKPLPSAALARLLPGIDGYIAGLDEIDATALAAADRLRVIARYGVGVDNVDLEAARARGITVTNTPGANAVSVAELTIALILALARQIPEAAVATRRGEWPRFSGISLKDKVIGLIGFGAIGQAVATRLAGFECRLRAYDPFMDRAAARRLGVEPAELGQLLPCCDFVSLHLPATRETIGMVDDAFIAQLRRGAYLINTARGELVNAGALVRGLESGQLGGAALDVFTEEPPAPDSPLLQAGRVILTPHMGAHADDAINAMGRIALTDCLRVLTGAEPEHRVA